MGSFVNVLLMAEGISIYSQNCRGLNATDKRRDVFHYVRQKKYDIICLQDVHLEKSMETYIQREWGYDIHMSPFLSNRRGVLTLINNSFEYSTGIVKKDPNGNFLITELTICGKKITLVNIYVMTIWQAQMKTT